eukprot:CAMPEP_0177168596 /NCGR_PEP_ID=MMETSP0367-20130122/9144_1 /TAXON_ID=447022 ORGANISM="Scrippsiella hangoei-like, Strain SHHI-4" /NCGR_SAMPLE_ID=MMETSP0367 /ASSEMBLY_ACC=CAM_ASM_000362 /LENGTH=85 /DNA_ID=CAMNT_0018614727 /DNA_START=153 /DNA_END=406 /DNA_ORIENTATION=-
MQDTCPEYPGTASRGVRTPFGRGGGGVQRAHVEVSREVLIYVTKSHAIERFRCDAWHVAHVARCRHARRPEAVPHEEDIPAGRLA